jgi:hypothetical protein
MDEMNWIDCTEPAQMLDHLSAAVNARKWRLFACAMVRQV